MRSPPSLCIQTGIPAVSLLALAAALLPLVACVPATDAPGDGQAPAEERAAGDTAAGGAPGQPEVFAAGPISAPSTNETWITFTQDGHEAIFSRYTDDFGSQTLYVAQRAETGWTEAAPAPFSGGHSDRGAYVAPDGRLFFSSDRPVTADAEPGTWRIWVVARADGRWGEPAPLPAPVNEAGDYHPAVAADGTVYWASADRPDGLGRSDVYAATPDGEGYAQPVHLSVNSATSEPDLYIDPEQRFMILAVTDREGGRGGDDLWLSRRQDGAWGDLVHLGDAVNTPEYEYGPYIHDGWLYFTSHRSGQADIYRIPVEDLPRLEP